MSSFLNMPGLVTFFVGQNEYCANILDLKGTVPSNDFENCFYCNTNDTKYQNVFYLLDNKKLFDSTAVKAKSLVLLLEIFNKKMGIVAERVNEYITLDKLFVESSMEILPCDNFYIKWTLNFNNRIIYYPDFEKIAKDFDILRKDFVVYRNKSKKIFQP